MATVNSEHQYRNNFSQLDVEKKTMLELKDEKTKLEVEESDKSGNQRIQTIALEKLKMYTPNKKERKVIR